MSKFLHILDRTAYYRASNDDQWRNKTANDIQVTMNVSLFPFEQTLYFEREGLYFDAIRKVTDVQCKGLSKFHQWYVRIFLRLEPKKEGSHIMPAVRLKILTPYL